MMVRKICLIASLAGLLLNPLKSAGADIAVFDQFTSAFDAGLFQGVQVGSELSLESHGDSGSTQGVNVIALSSYNGKAAQVSVVNQDVSLILSAGSNVVQGVNVYRGYADTVTQMAFITGAVTMSSRNNTSGIQGINVITSCSTCN